MVKPLGVANMPRIAKTTEEKSDATVAEATAADQTTILEVPLSEPMPSAFPIHVNLQLDASLGMVLRRIAKGYDRQQATLKNGRRVVDPHTAVRKLLEDVAESMCATNT